MCILFEYTCTLLKVVSYYDLSVLTMSVMRFQKKAWMVGRWGELYPILFEIFGPFLTLQSPPPNAAHLFTDLLLLIDKLNTAVATSVPVRESQVYRMLHNVDLVACNPTRSLHQDGLHSLPHIVAM